MSQLRKLIQIKNELGPWNICFPQPSEFPGPVQLAAAQQLCQHRAGGWHGVRAEQPLWRREGGTVSLLTYSAKSDTELRQPPLGSRAFSFHVFKHYIKRAEYFVTKYQQKHGSKGMHLDAVRLILLVFQWCDTVVSFGYKWDRTLYWDNYHGFCSLHTLPQAVLLQGSLPHRCWCSCVTMAALSPAQQAVAHSHSQHSPGTWALLVQPLQPRDQEITPQDCQTTFDFFSQRVISFNFAPATCLNKF